MKPQQGMGLMAEWRWYRMHGHGRPPFLIRDRRAELLARSLYAAVLSAESRIARGLKLLQIARPGRVASRDVYFSLFLRREIVRTPFTSRVVKRDLLRLDLSGIGSYSRGTASDPELVASNYNLLLVTATARSPYAWLFNTTSLIAIVADKRIHTSFRTQSSEVTRAVASSASLPNRRAASVVATPAERATPEAPPSGARWWQNRPSWRRGPRRTPPWPPSPADGGCKLAEWDIEAGLRQPDGSNGVEELAHLVAQEQKIGFARTVANPGIWHKQARGAHRCRRRRGAAIITCCRHRCWPGRCVE
eukprot:5361076-Pleurochrysis_carterae.AAC.2